jgi:hypothetical protein
MPGKVFGKIENDRIAAPQEPVHVGGCRRHCLEPPPPYRVFPEAPKAFLD